MSKEDLQYKLKKREVKPAQHAWTLTKEQVIQAVTDYVAKHTGEAVPAGKPYLYGLEDRGMIGQRLTLSIIEADPEAEDE